MSTNVSKKEWLIFGGVLSVVITAGFVWAFGPIGYLALLFIPFEISIIAMSSKEYTYSREKGLQEKE